MVVVVGNDTEHLGIATDCSYVAPATAAVAVIVPVFPLDTHTLCTHFAHTLNRSVLALRSCVHPSCALCRYRIDTTTADRGGTVNVTVTSPPRAVWRAGRETVSQLY